MPSTATPPETTDRFTREGAASDGLSDPPEVPRGGWRERARSNPATRQPYRVGVFVLGLLFIAGGLALAVLPGPLTIPPVLIGLWIWSSEFAFAERFFDAFKEKADDAWEHAKRHPASSAAITIGGLVAAGAGFWAVQHFGLIEDVKAALF